MKASDRASTVNGVLGERRDRHPERRRSGDRLARGARADRAFTANVLGTLALTVADRVDSARPRRRGTARTRRPPWSRCSGTPTARSRSSPRGCASRIPARCSSSTAWRRTASSTASPALDGRTKLLALTAARRGASRSTCSPRAASARARRRRARRPQVRALPTRPARCWRRSPTTCSQRVHVPLCDELACPDARCPVERAEPRPRTGAAPATASPTATDDDPFRHMDDGSPVPHDAQDPRGG